jgi:hypothetical protein
MLKPIHILLLTLIFPLLGWSQTEHSNERKSNKGRLYTFWGWNRAWYTDSDIHFTGENYDFTLSDVKAFDRQTPFNLDPYFSIGRITIPQTNFRIGYFINDKLDLSFGYDHMKYVMPNYRTVKINGFINTGNKYDGHYLNDEIFLLSDFLTFEHTDGLNYFDIELTRNDNLLELFKVTHNPNKITLNTLLGFGVGFLLPRSNVMLLNNTRYDEFHLAGYGFSAKTGLDLILYKYFFLRGELKAGFIDMPSIRSTPDTKDNASQHFFFSQANICFGFTYNFSKKLK